MSDSREIESNDPVAVFAEWMAEAEKSEPNDPNAAALATAAEDGAPSVRMVLVKQWAGHRFCFFTNVESRKGVQLMANPRVALCFHWKTLRRQVRLEGVIRELDAGDVDTYFHSRGRMSQIGAAVSDQSRVLGSREELEGRVRRFEQEHAQSGTGEIPRPVYWRGFYVIAARIEFWIDGANRLHDRFLFTRTEGGWDRVRLYP